MDCYFILWLITYNSIIYFSAQVMPDSSSRNPFTLAPIPIGMSSFIFFLAHRHLLAQQDVPGSSGTVPAPAMGSAMLPGTLIPFREDGI